MQRSFLRRAPAALAAALALSLPAGATWSIVAVNTQTGEVVIASATCLENFNLIKDLPVMRVGYGGAVSQGLIDFGAVHRLMIWNGFIAGDTPSEILNTLLTTGSTVQQRQWGIVDFTNPPETFSGTALGHAYHGVTGVIGELRYAIQGNVLTADTVVTAAEAALLNTPGDMTQRVMAGMEAARALGGDGRCSCLTGPPDSCGAPPPGFTKSAHASFLVASRIGDVDGTCSWALGCATEQYYVKLSVKGDWDDIDPVIQLEQDYAKWRSNMARHPDGVKSKATAPVTKLVADGATSIQVHVALVDIEGQSLGHGGTGIMLSSASGAPPLATLTDVDDHGDGTYTLTLTAGNTAGSDELAIRASDNFEAATLYPFLHVDVDPLADLHVGVESLSASSGGTAPFVLNLGPAAAGHPYILLASLSGTRPGLDLGGSILPLNPDAVLQFTLAHPGGALLPGSLGTLDASGRGEADFAPPAGLLSPIVGLHLDWAAVDFAWPFDATGSVGLEIAP
jgi:uncharacterized Ntn-hydrolase superfamily protein